MATPNFASILDQPADAVKPPPLLPPGTYDTVIVGLPEAGQSAQKKTDFFKFTHRIIAAGDDVDPDELNEAFPDGVAGKTVDNTFYLTENSLFMLTEFMKNCGVEMEGKSVRACIDEVPNSRVRIHIKHEPSQDGQRVFARVGRTLPAED